MKSCPKCKMMVGGQAEYCPLCQSELIGAGTEPAYPRVEAPRRRISLAYKLVAFVLLAATVICITVDLLTPGAVYWSFPVALCAAVLLTLLRLAMNARPNVPRLLFQMLVGISATVILCDWYIGFTGFSTDIVVPILCSATLIANFVLAFIKKSFAENGLVYLLMNIVIGVAPYLLLFLRVEVRPMAWVVCLVISIITFLGLVVFRGRDLLVEMQKRFHM